MEEVTDQHDQTLGTRGGREDGPRHQECLQEQEEGGDELWSGPTVAGQDQTQTCLQKEEKKDTDTNSQ